MISGKEGKSEILNGAVVMTISVLIVKLIGFVYKLPLSYILGDEGMGFFNSAYTVFGLFYTLCIGGIPRAISIITARANESQRRSILKYSLLFFIIIGSVFSFILFVFSPLIADIIGNKLSRFSIVCIAPSLMFISASGVLRGYLNGHEKLSYVAIAEVIEGVIKFIVGFCLALYAHRRGYSAPIISAYTILGVTVGSIIGSLFLYISVNILNKAENTGQKCQNNLRFKVVIKSILCIALPITAGAFISSSYGTIDLILLIRGLKINVISEKTAVALYGNYSTLVIPILNFAVALLSSLSTAWLPRLASTYVTCREEYSKFSIALVRLTSYTVVPMACIIGLFAEDILVLLFKNESAYIAYPYLRALAPSIMLLPALTALNTALESGKRVLYSFVSLLTGAIFKLVSEIILLNFTGLLLYSAPISTNIGYGIAFTVSFIFFSRETNASREVLSALISAIVGAASSFLIARYFVFLRINIIGHTLSLLLSFALGCVIYAVYLVIFKRKEIVNILTFVGFDKKIKKRL